MLGDAEVGHFCVAGCRQQDVGRLDIAVDVPLRMQKGKADGGLLCDGHAMPEADFATLGRRHVELQKLVERPPIEVLHHNRQRPVEHRRPYEYANAWVAELRQRRRLDLQRRAIVLRHLDRDVRADPFAGIDLSVTTLPKEPPPLLEVLLGDGRLHDCR